MLIAGLSAFAVILIAVGLFVFRPQPWPRDAILVPRDAPTLQEALVRATPGTTIVLQARNEPFLGPLTIDVSGIVLASEHTGIRLEASGADAALRILADDVVVRGLEIRAPAIGLQVDGARCHTENLVIRDAAIGVQLRGASGCRLEDTEIHGGRTGLELVSSDNNRFAHLHIRGTTEQGIHMAHSQGNRFEATVVTETPNGIVIDQGSTMTTFAGCRIERIREVGFRIRASNGTRLLDCTVLDCRDGIILEGVTETELVACEIERSSGVGISLRQAARNRLIENSVSTPGSTGIHLIQSLENTLSFNRVTNGGKTGVRLEASNRNLLIGNRVLDTDIGIHADGASENQLLRNRVTGSDRVAVFLDGGSGNRLLDNDVGEGAVGIVLAGSRDNVVLRNHIRATRVCGLSVSDGSRNNDIADNDLDACRLGLSIADSANANLLNNRLHDNEIAILLTEPNARTRIEGNAIAHNEIGLSQQGRPEELRAALEQLSAPRGNGSRIAPTDPAIANNFFSENRLLDISNHAENPLYAAGNWWGDRRGAGAPRQGSVSGGVLLEASAWHGTIALGTGDGLVEVLLGQLLRLTLVDRGFRVVNLIGIDDGQRVTEAFSARDVDIVWLDTSAPLEAVVHTIPGVRRWSVVVPEAWTGRLAESTVSSLALHLAETGRSLVIAAPPGLDDAAFDAFIETYGLEGSVETVTRAATLEEAETLLKFGVAGLAVVDNLEEVLTASGFVSLEDDLGAFPPVGISALLRPELVARFPDVEEALADLGPRLTESTIHDLIGRSRLLDRDPEAVALDYLQQEMDLVD